MIALEKLDSKEYCKQQPINFIYRPLFTPAHELFKWVMGCLTFLLFKCNANAWKEWFKKKFKGRNFEIWNYLSYCYFGAEKSQALARVYPFQQSFILAFIMFSNALTNEFPIQTDSENLSFFFPSKPSQTVTSTWQWVFRKPCQGHFIPTELPVVIYQRLWQRWFIL